MTHLPRTGFPAIAATAAAVAAIVAALILLGSPARAREHRLDELRAQDLASVSNALDLYWTKHGALPDTVDSLVSTALLDRIPTDPATGARYPIHLTGSNSYRLCARFSQPFDSTNVDQREYYGGLHRGAHAWRHGAGESCFDFVARRTDDTPFGPDRLDEIRVAPKSQP